MTTPHLPVAPQAVTSTTRGVTSDDIVVTPTAPSPVYMYMSRINRNKDDQYSYAINIRTERCCQCDDHASRLPAAPPAVTNQPAAPQATSWSSHRQPRPQCTYFGVALVEIKKINHSVINNSKAEH